MMKIIKDHCYSFRVISLWINVLFLLFSIKTKDLCFDLSTGLEHTVSAHSVVGIKDRYYFCCLIFFLLFSCWLLVNIPFHATEVLNDIAWIDLFFIVAIIISRKRTYWTILMTQIFLYFGIKAWLWSLSL